MTLTRVERSLTPMQLDCGLCRVRPWRMSDLDVLVRHADNRNIWLQLRDRFPHPYTRQNGKQWLAAAIMESPATAFAIEVDEEAVGGIGLVLGVDVERVSAEIGYWLAESLWGRGIAAAALRAVTEYAFGEYGLTRIFALPFADNVRSCRVLEKAGYTRDCLLRRSAIKEGQIRDQALYSRVR